jgi:hypothetical protein
MSTKTTSKATDAGLFPKTFGEDYLKLMKFSFETAFENAVKVQDLNVKIWQDLYDAGKEAQSEAYKMVDGLIDDAKKGRVEYKKAVEDGFKKVEEML